MGLTGNVCFVAAGYKKLTQADVDALWDRNKLKTKVHAMELGPIKQKEDTRQPGMPGQNFKNKFKVKNVNYDNFRAFFKNVRVKQVSLENYLVEKESGLDMLEFDEEENDKCCGLEYRESDYEEGEVSRNGIVLLDREKVKRKLFQQSHSFSTMVEVGELRYHDVSMRYTVLYFVSHAYRPVTYFLLQIRHL